jgi:hypothetical protein
LGESSQLDASLYVQSILNAKSEYENILHRDLLMALRCLADDVRVDADSCQIILKRIESLYFAAETPPSLIQDISKLLGYLVGTSFQPYLEDMLEKRLPAPEGDVSNAVANAIDQMKREAISIKGKALDESTDSSLVSPTFIQEMTTEYGDINKYIDSLLAQLSHAQSEKRELAARRLSHINNLAISEPIIPKLLTQLSSNKPLVCEGAARALGQMNTAAARTDVISKLVNLLSDSDNTVRYIASQSLRNLAGYITTKESPNALKLLLQLAQSDGNLERDVGYDCLHRLLEAVKRQPL